MKLKHIALQASAGSGKTFTLSVRYLALVLSGANINDIVALTFTKKAVNEMKERIYDVFLHLEEKNNELSYLEELLSLKRNEIIKIRDQKKEDFLNTELRIYTFDSFFSKILRLFASYEGLSPNYEQCDNLDIRSEFLNSLNEDEAIELISNLKELNMEISDFLDWLVNLHLNYTGVNVIDEYEKIDLLNEYEKLKPYLLSNTSQINKWMSSIEDTDSLIKAFESMFDSKTYIKECEKNITFLQASEQMYENISKYFGFYESKRLKLCFLYLEKFAALNKQIHKRDNLLSFSDVALYVHKILQNNDLKDLFYFRLNSELSHLLIDEFQDTSIIQYEIIKPIVEEIVSGIGINDKEKSFFYVGDKKQSIYAFRGAKQEVFDLFYKDTSYNIELENLMINYRSDKSIVEFVNKTFSSLYDNYIPQQVHSQNEGLVAKINISSLDYLENILKYVQCKMKQNVKLEDICILTRNNTEAKNIANYLENNFIQVCTNNTVNLYDLIQVRVLVEYAKYIVFEDEAYKFFVEECLAKNIDKIKIDITKNAGLIYLELAKYLDLKFDEELLEFIYLMSYEKDFLSTLYEEKILNSSNINMSGINIMTIHKSKGLQFKYVLVLHLNTRTVNDAGLKIDYDFTNSSWFGFKKEREKINLIRSKYDIKFKEKLSKYETAKNIDNINLYYVAYTRAKSELILLLEDTKKCIDANFEELMEYDFKETLELAESNEVQKTNNIDYDFSSNVPLQNIKTSNTYKDEAILFGEAFHYFCELSDFKKDSLNDCIQIVINKFYMIDQIKLKRICSSLLECKDFINLIQDCNLIKEYNFCKDNNIGRIDLLAFKDNVIKIIDYKSSIFNIEYKKQLKKYSEFLKTVFINHTIKSYVIVYEEEKFKIIEI